MRDNSAVAVLENTEAKVRIQKIMVAYDFSPFAEVALQYATPLARRFGAEMTIVHAESPTELGIAGEYEWATLKTEYGHAARDLDSVVRALRDQGISGTSVFRAGSAGDVLVQLTAELRPDMLVMGAYGHRKADASRLGSTAEFVLRCVPCPALTIGPQVTFRATPRPIRQILYASSMPVSCGKAIHVAGLFAKDSPVSVEVVHVIDHHLAEIKGRSAEMGNRGRDLVRQFERLGIHAHWQLRTGSAAEEIVGRAVEILADLIVFGMEPHPVGPGVLGVISKTVGQAGCPVLTVAGPA
jgi:universal stress protein A